MKDMNINMPNDVKYILDIFKQNNYKAYIVGGCVRDSIMGITPHDWDITANALPNDTINIFKNLGFNVVETGIKHGTITVFINNVGYEITVFRVESEYLDGRHPSKIDFVNNISEDLARRDFTINAMAYNYEDGLIDIFNGMDDLKKGIIKCVGNAEERFTEDGLRILRAIRFACKYNFEIENKTEKAILTCKERLKIISVERIKDEMTKILSFKVMKYFDLLAECIEFFLPELKTCIGFDQKNPNHCFTIDNHTIVAMAFINHKNEKIKETLKWIMFFHDLGKPNVCEEENGVRHFRKHGLESSKIAERVVNFLNFDNESVDMITTLVLHHDSIWQGKTKNIKRILNKIGPEYFELLLLVREADIMAQQPSLIYQKMKTLYESKKIYEDIMEQNQAFSRKQLMINGNDLIKLGYKGKIIGEILEDILEKIIDEILINDKDKLLEYVSINF